MIPVSKIELFRTKIIKACPSCKGKSCQKCLSQYSRIVRYAEAGIPVDYWLLSWKTFSGDVNLKNAIKTKLDDLDLMFESGESLAIIGNFGTGKTYAGCSILKKAIMKDYNCCYMTMAEIVSNILSKESRLSDIIEKDFLMIDEVDNRHIASSEKAEELFGTMMENIFRTRFQNQLPTIICSNVNDIGDIFTGAFGKAFSSLSSKYMKVLIASGKDFRKNVKIG